MAPSVAPPGRMGYSTRIQRVAISPQESNLFATLENFNIHIWDCDIPSAPAMTKKISDWPVTGTNCLKLEIHIAKTLFLTLK